MAARERLICAASALVDGGPGVRFEVRRAGEVLPAFAIRHQGRVTAYLNRCGHQPMELDWRAGEFFDAEQQGLICSTHGARYDAASGACRGGPCNGVPLVPVRIEERGGKVYEQESDDG